MTPQQHDLLIGALSILCLVIFSIMFSWLGQRSRKRYMRKWSDRFEYFDTLYEGSEKELENELEIKRKEKVDIFKYSKDPLRKKTENIDVTRYSGKIII